MKRAYIPKRGDIILTNFDLPSGTEQTHERPALVLSPEPFNRQIPLALVAPVTSTVKGHGFEVVPGTDTKTQGAVLCQQVKTIDYQSGGVKFVEKALQKNAHQIHYG